MFYSFSVLVFHLQFMADGLSEVSGIPLPHSGNAHFAEMHDCLQLVMFQICSLWYFFVSKLHEGYLPTFSLQFGCWASTISVFLRRLAPWLEMWLQYFLAVQAKEVANRKLRDREAKEDGETKTKKKKLNSYEVCVYSLQPSLPSVSYPHFNCYLLLCSLLVLLPWHQPEL